MSAWPALDFLMIGGVIGEMTLGIGNLLTQGMQVALLHWQRTAELTADRAGLLACQDPDAGVRATMKLAGMPHKYRGQCNTASFIQQARHFEKLDATMFDKAAKLVSGLYLTHPWVIIRAKELIEWVENGGYDQVLKLPYPLVTQETALKRVLRSLRSIAKAGG